MTQSFVQRSLAGGEIGHELTARVDQVKYQTGAKTMRNMFVRRSGGASNRSGTQWIAEVADSSKRPYFLRFILNDQQAYVFEVGGDDGAQAGENYIRLYQNGVRLSPVGAPSWSDVTTYGLGRVVEFTGFYFWSKQDGNLNKSPVVEGAWWRPMPAGIYELPGFFFFGAVPDLTKLKTVQKGTLLTVTTGDGWILEVERKGEFEWPVRAGVFVPSIGAPTGAAAVNGTAGTIVHRYKVTALKIDTEEESLPTATFSCTGGIPTLANPNVLTWNAPTAGGQSEYNVYKETSDGVAKFGFIGRAGSLAGVPDGKFNDTNFTPDASLSIPAQRTFPTGQLRGITATYHQQRFLVANEPIAEKNKVWGSKSGQFTNFTITSPLQDDDSIAFSIVGRSSLEIRHLIDLGRLMLLTSEGVWVALGDADGVLKATQSPNPTQVSYIGVGELVPVIVDNSILYVQARGAIIRDLKSEPGGKNTDVNYNGRDLTIYAPHLFDKRRAIDRWALAQTPHSIVWAVRSDGVMVALTYLREHEIWGWHRHDTDGVFEDVITVPEGQEDAVYVLVRRTINGATKRYVERMASREIVDIALDAKFLDSHLTYDGRNLGATTMTLSTGGGWTVNDLISVAASVAFFAAGDVGNAIVIDDAATGDKVSVLINEFVSNVLVKGYPNKNIPVSLQGVAKITWGKAVDELSGLGHLEGKAVSIIGDGKVIASPNNPNYDVRTIVAGSVSPILADPYVVIHVGLPYFADFQTLDIDIPNEPLRDKEKNVTGVALLLNETRGGFIGPDFETMDEIPPEDILAGEEGPPPLASKLVDVNIASTYNQGGSFAVRQVDPLPMTILAVIPHGEVGG